MQANLKRKVSLLIGRTCRRLYFFFLYSLIQKICFDPVGNKEQKYGQYAKVIIHRVIWFRKHIVNLLTTLIVLWQGVSSFLHEVNEELFLNRSVTCGIGSIMYLLIYTTLRLVRLKYYFSIKHVFMLYPWSYKDILFLIQKLWAKRIVNDTGVLIHRYSLTSLYKE